MRRTKTTLIYCRTRQQGGHSERAYNYNLAARRAKATRDAIERQYPGKFDISIYPDPAKDAGTETQRTQAWDTATGWGSRAARDSTKWSVDVSLLNTASPEVSGAIAVSRPPATKLYSLST